MGSTELKMKMTKVAIGLVLALSTTAAAVAQTTSPAQTASPAEPAQTVAPPPAPAAAEAPIAQPADSSSYIIATGDELQIFVWKNPDLSTTAPVRPDGKITAPLVQDIQAQGKTPIQLQNDLTVALSKYVLNPVVTVVVKTFSAPSSEAAIRVIGSAVEPKTVPYRRSITALDVMIQLGGLPVYASGNNASILRTENGATHAVPLRLNDLMKKGDLKANVTLMPGDVIRIPERFF